jgi:hypothetical protein
MTTFTHGDSNSTERSSREHHTGSIRKTSQVSGGLWTVAAFISFREAYDTKDSNERVFVGYRVKHVKKRLLVRGGGFMSFGDFRTITRGMERNSTCHYGWGRVVLDGTRVTKAVDVGETSTDFTMKAVITFPSHEGGEKTIELILEHKLIQELTKLMAKVDAELMDYDGYDPINTKDLAVNTYDDEENDDS